VGDLGDDLLDEATAARLRRARAGEGVARRLLLAALVPGDVGVLEVQVRSVAPTRSYNRKRGGEGLLQRVTLADASGEADLVLWDDEVRQAKDGPFQPGAFLRLRGAAVKAGHRGGVELGLGSALVERIAAPAPPAPGPARAGPLEGVLRSFGEVRPVGAPPALRFTMEASLDTPSGPVRVAAWDDAVKQLRAAGLGATVRLPNAEPNPLLDGWWTVRAPVERL
jgi:hypothetical protein